MLVTTDASSLPPSPPLSPRSQMMRGTWRKCSQEALQTLPPSDPQAGNTLPTGNPVIERNLRRSRDEENPSRLTIQAAAASAQLLPAAALPRQEPSSLKERFQRIQGIDQLRGLPFGQRMLTFPEALSFFASPRNRYPDNLPTSLDLVALSQRTDPKTNYINASRFAHTIITQGPLLTDKLDTVADLWVMLFEQGTNLVCLTHHRGQVGQALVEKTFPYWDPALDGIIVDPKQPELVYKDEIGGGEHPIILEVRLVEGPHVAVQPNAKNERVTRRVFEIVLGDRVKRVNHWLAEEWKDQSVWDENQLAALIELLLGSDPAIVHCSAGLGRAGVFAVAKLMIERYLATGRVPTDAEIDQAVVDLRKRRPGSVQSPEQLELISKTIHAFIKKKSV